MRTIPKMHVRDGKRYYLHSRAGDLAIYRLAKDAGFLVVRIVFVPERPFRYSGKAVHERLARRGDQFAFHSCTLPSLAEAQSRVAEETVFDKQQVERAAILKEGGGPARKLRKIMNAETEAFMREYRAEQAKLPPRPSILENLPFVIPRE